jgi:metal-responsive CopG/Arc/MetJ family transcriptional regulator
LPIISLQISGDLLDRFEKLRIQSGFNSKSEALRDAIVSFIENQERFDDLSGYKIMTINMVYPFKEVITDEITETYNNFKAIIKTVTDWRIADKKIETLMVVGEFGIIKDLYRGLSKIKDVICSIHEVIID